MPDSALGLGEAGVRHDGDGCLTVGLPSNA